MDPKIVPQLRQRLLAITTKTSIFNMDKFLDLPQKITMTITAIATSSAITITTIIIIMLMIMMTIVIVIMVIMIIIITYIIGNRSLIR